MEHEGQGHSYYSSHIRMADTTPVVLSVILTVTSSVPSPISTPTEGKSLAKKTSVLSRISSSLTVTFTLCSESFGEKLTSDVSGS